MKPRMKLHGAWFFGFNLDLNVLDETSKHDATSIIEMLARGIQQAATYVIVLRCFSSKSSNYCYLHRYLT